MLSVLHQRHRFVCVASILRYGQVPVVARQLSKTVLKPISNDYVPKKKKTIFTCIMNGNLCVYNSNLFGNASDRMSRKVLNL